MFKLKNKPFISVNHLSLSYLIILAVLCMSMAFITKNYELATPLGYFIISTFGIILLSLACLIDNIICYGFKHLSETINHIFKAFHKQQDTIKNPVTSVIKNLTIDLSKHINFIDKEDTSNETAYYGVHEYISLKYYEDGYDMIHDILFHEVNTFEEKHNHICNINYLERFNSVTIILPDNIKTIKHNYILGMLDALFGESSDNLNYKKHRINNVSIIYKKSNIKIMEVITKAKKTFIENETRNIKCC